MWGAKPALNLDFAKILIKRLIHGSIEMRKSHGKGLDQLLLGRYVFPFLDGKYYQSPFRILHTQKRFQPVSGLWNKEFL